MIDREMDYLTLKMVHIVGAIIFMGNIIVTALWKTMADRTRSSAVIAYSQRLVTLTDVVFTGTGATIVLVTGLLMVMNFEGGFWSVRWVWWGIALFTASGIIWGAALIPLQIRLSRLTSTLSPDDVIPDEYWRLERRWMTWGVLATLLPLVNVYFMVFKPT